MSESDQVLEKSIAPNKMWTTKMEDGQLQIVEVTPFDKSEDDISDTTGTRVVKDHDNEYTTLQMQMVETDKGLMQLDLLNMTLVKCSEGEVDGNESYRLLSGSEASEVMQEEIGMVTCVLQQSDGDSDDQEDNVDSFIVMDGGKQSYMYLRPTAKAKSGKPTISPTKPKLSPVEILQKTKAVQRAKAAMNLRPPLRGRPGRRKMESTSSTNDIMSSSTLKLYLYSCKMCPFKCNAIKELSTHKKKEHGTGAGRGRGAGRYSSPMQCAGCTYRATTHSELLRHVKNVHGNENNKTEIVVARSSEDVTRLLEEGDSGWGTTHVLVCGACGMETSTAAEFKAHPCSPIVLD